MSAHRLGSLALAAASCLTGQYTYYLPQVSDGNTGNGSLRTTVVVANVARTAANARMTVTGDDAMPVPLTFAGLGTGANFTTRLAAGASRLWTSDGKGDGSPGAVVITSDSPLRASVIVSSVNGSGDVISESAIPAVSGEELGLEYLAPVDATAGVDSGIALYNPSPASAQITARLLDTDGVQVATTALPLRAGGRATLPASRLAGPNSNFRGTLVVSSSVRLAAIAVRQNSSSPAYSLLPAADRRSGALHFFLPHVEDGQSETGTKRTTFLLTNLSSKEASVKMTLALDDGTPFSPAISGVVSGDGFQGKIAPGATVVWQTDGGSETLKSGTAVIRSDHPLGVSAVITSFDASGSFVSETGIVPAPRNVQFLIPFANGGGGAPVAAFFNTSPGEDLTITLDLLDPEGKLLESRPFGPLAKGARVTTVVSELFPTAPATGAIRVSSGPLQPFLSAAGARQAATGQRLSTTPAAILPWMATGTPTTVRPSLDPARKTSAAIGPRGGALSLTDGKGNRFTLTIPAQAVLAAQTITMTAISSASGLPGPGFVAGVQLEPDGLVLFTPATLKMELAGPVPDGVLPVGWRGDRPGVYQNPTLPGTGPLTVFLSHFSGAGVGAVNLTVELQSVAGILELSQATIAHYLGQARQLSLLGREEESLQKRAAAVAASETAYEWALRPFMELALRSQDPDIMYCALVQSLQYEQSRQFAGISGLGEGPDPIGEEMREFRSQLYDLRLQILMNRCKLHDFTAFSELLGAGRQEIIFGGNTFPYTEDLINTIQQCLPRLQLDYAWRMTTKAPGLGSGSIEYDGKIEGTMVLEGSFSKSELTVVRDPSKDLDTSFVLTGAFLETYKTARLTNTSTVPLCGQLSIRNLTTEPAVMKVVRDFGTDQDPQHSQVKFTFEPHYDPAARTLGGEQLCSFCPVFRKVPVSVQLMLDPGKPVERFEQVCGSVVTKADSAWWHVAFEQLYSVGIDYLRDWTMANVPELLARKTVARSRQLATITMAEEAAFELKPCTGLTEPSSLGQKCTK